MREMNRKGVLCDVSHLNEAGFWDVIEHSTLPPVASHSNARALCEHTRNLTEAQIRAVIEKKGYIGVNFYSAFLANGRAATLEDVYRHVDAILQLGGEDVVGFGSDFDGIDAWPEGLANPAISLRYRLFGRARRLRARGAGEDRGRKPVPRAQGRRSRAPGVNRGRAGSVDFALVLRARVREAGFGENLLGAYAHGSRRVARFSLGKRAISICWSLYARHQHWKIRCPLYGRFWRWRRIARPKGWK